MNLSRILLALVPVLALAGCVTSKDWAAAGGNRETGIVKVAYQYAEFQERSLSDEQAEHIAEGRCNVWGYAHADIIPGQLRECSVTDGGNCKIWTVTREYQCSGDENMARDRTNGGGGSDAEGPRSAQVAPLHVAR